MDGSAVGYQNWFYPHKNADYLLYSSRGICAPSLADILYKSDPGGYRLNVYNQLRELQHFQPQLSPNRQCVAEIMPGYKNSSRQWVKIDCDQQFHNVPVICESHTTDYVPPNNEQVDQTIYASIKRIEKNNSTLVVVNNYCSEGWLHVSDACYRICPSAQDQCVTLDNTFISTLNIPPWKYIAQHFSHVVLNNQTNLSLCRSSVTAESLETIHGLYQCADFTYIAKHHVCDGEVDCPDASDEMDCNDVCTFFVPLSNLSCYTLCTSDICTCNRLYFQCTAGGCISLSKFCDGIINCRDMSDEILCLNESQVSQHYISDEDNFRCKSGHTIDILLVNDTVPDCPVHGDDEVWPSDSMSNIMVSGDSVMIACIPGHPKMFYHHLLCQLTWDSTGHLATCRNGGHLSDCIYHSCPHQYKCPYSYCIPVHAICDGRVDCPDGNDETDCYPLVCRHLLKCKADNRCIQKNDVNNGIITCPSYHDDEVGMTSCPNRCECVGLAVYCVGKHLSSYIEQVALARSLIIKVDDISVVNSETFSTFLYLKYLDLSDNRFSYFHTGGLRNLQLLAKLVMVNVSLSVIPEYFFQGLFNVKIILLKGNNICRIEKHAFHGMLSLPELDLSHQMLSNIASCSFFGLKVLKTLNVSYNLISTLNQNTLCGLHNLTVLDLTGNSIIIVHPSSFAVAMNLQILESSIQGICCYKSFEKCSPKIVDYFASCTSILADLALQYGVWSIAVLIIIGNIAALCTSLSLTSKQSKKRIIHALYQFNLTLSDLSMGCYFLLLALLNAVYEGDFVQVASLWKSGLPCKSLAFISFLSFQMTMYMTLILSLERCVALCMPMNTFLTRLRLARLVVLFGWILSAAIVAFPVVTAYFHQIQLNNAMCIMMVSFRQFHFSYGLTVIILNSIISLCNIFLCSSVIHLLHQRKKRLAAMTSQQQHKHRDATITIRIICIVLTNSTCWMFMVIMEILLQSGVAVREKIFSISAVSALPVSALLNPILNIFTTSEFVEACKSMACRN